METWLVELIKNRGKMFAAIAGDYLYPEAYLEDIVAIKDTRQEAQDFLDKYKMNHPSFDYYEVIDLEQMKKRLDEFNKLYG